MENSIFTVLGLVAAFVLQSTGATALGVRYDDEEVSFPRRLFRKRDIVALWRRRIRLDSIDRIDARSERTVRLYLRSTERVDVRFTDRIQKQEFMNAMERFKATKLPPQSAARVGGTQAGKASAA